MNIVEFDEGRVILNVQHEAFLELKGTKADDKSIYYKKMFYVYNVSDYNAPPFRLGYDELETHNYAVLAAKLPKDFVPDIKTANAIKAYFELRDTVTINYLRELYKSMSSGIKTAKMLNDINEELLKQASTIKAIDTESLKEKSGLISTIANNQTILFDMASKSEAYIEKVKSLLEKAKMEEERLERAFGGGIVTESMIPNEY